MPRSNQGLARALADLVSKRHLLSVMLLLSTLLAAPAASHKAVAQDASYHKAEQYLEAGNASAALIEAKNALQADPNHVPARILLGKIYLQVGDTQAAESAFLRARELGASGEELDLLIAYARLRRGAFEAVLSEAAGETEIDTDVQRDLHVARGEALLGLGRFDEAQAVFDRVLQDGPHSRALVNKARIAMVIGDSRAARELLDQAAAIAPDDPVFVAADATWYFQERQFEEAGDRFALAIRLDSTRLESYIGKIQSHMALGELEQAAEIIEELKDTNSDLPAVVLQDAIVQFLRGRYVEAGIAARRVLAAVRLHPQALLVAGQSAYQLGQYEQARAHLSAYLAQNPEDQQTRMALGSTMLNLGESKEAYRILGSPAGGEIPDSAAYLDVLTSAAFGAGDREAGLRYLEQLAAKQAKDTGLQERLGAARQQHGDYAGAAEAFERAIALAPDRRSAYTRLSAVRLQLDQPEAALDVARRMQTQFPDSSLGDTLLGITHLANRQPKEARAAFRRALEKEPDNAEAAGNLANILVIEGELAEARAVLDRVLEAKPDHLRTLMTAAELARQAGDDAAAEALWRRAVEADPDARQPRILLGNHYIRNNRAADALALAEPALANNPNSLGLLETVGQARLRAGDTVGALDAFQILAALVPDSVPAQEYLMRTLELNGQIDEALRAAEHILTLDGDNLEARFGQVRYLAQLGRLGEARAQLEPLKAEHPDRVDILLLEGRIALLDGRGAEAVSASREAFELARNNRTLVELARILFATGQGDEAVALMEGWLEEYPQDVLTRAVLAEGQITMNKLAEADRQYEAILELTPNNVRALNNLAWIKMTTGSTQDALALGRRALELVPDSPSVADTLAVILLEAGEKQEALDLLQSARQAAADNVSIHFHFARALAENGQVEVAVSELRSLLEQDKVFRERPQAEALLAELTR